MTPPVARSETLTAAMGDACVNTDAGGAAIEAPAGTAALEALDEQNRHLRAALAERQRAEARLEELLSMFGAILESVMDGVMVFDRDGRIVRFNQRFVDLWRIPVSATLFWEHDSIMSHVAARLKDPEAFRSAIDDLHLHPEAQGFHVAVCADGRTIEQYSLPPPQGVEGVGRVFSFRDVTDRKLADMALLREKEEQRALIEKLEEAHNQLLQSEKMASIGQLAAGVAHEINNPIGFVNSNLATLGGYIEQFLALIAVYEDAEPSLGAERLAAIQAIKEKIELDYLKEDVVSLIRESADGVERVRRIVQDLKDFSHVGGSDWQWVDLHSGIDSTLNIVNNEIKYKAEVVREYAALPEVECLPSQLNQVFMNLLVNAAHAMTDERGTITIRTAAVNEEVCVEFTDNGSGITPENMKRIFDPFFTTKPVGKGTGLGLSLSYSIVAKHHGRIEVESEPGKGTTFRITLPVKQPAAEAARIAA